MGGRTPGGGSEALRPGTDTATACKGTLRPLSYSCLHWLQRGNDDGHLCSPSSKLCRPPSPPFAEANQLKRPESLRPLPGVAGDLHVLPNDSGHFPKATAGFQSWQGSALLAAASGAENLQQAAPGSSPCPSASCALYTGSSKTCHPVSWGWPQAGPTPWPRPVGWQGAWEPAPFFLPQAIVTGPC